MPYASDGDSDPRLRILAYGREKSRKTLWAAMCAEYGFNVVFINGEPGGTQIFKAKDLKTGKPFLSKEALERILICDATDTSERAVFASFMAQLCKPENKFTWDEETQATIFGLRNTAHSFIQFDASKLTLNDVVICDSWTALSSSTSFQYAKEHDIDVTDADKTEWDGYGFEGRFLDFVLRNISTWNCHVIVIAHAYTYEKWTPGKGPDRKLISSTLQPISSSGPHGVKVPNKFNDVLYFDRTNSGEIFTISTDGSKETVGGSRIMPPVKNARWETLLPQKFFEAVGCKPTGEPCLGAVYLPPGTEQLIPGKATIKTPNPTMIDAGKAAPQVSTAMGGSVLSRIKGGG